MKPILFSVLLVLCSLAHCGNPTSTDVLLNTEFLTATPIKLISPLNDDRTQGLPDFFWTGPSGSATYTVEISTSVDFSAPIVTKIVNTPNYKLTATDIKGATKLQPITHFWRVKSAVRNSLYQSAVGSFFHLDDSGIYVNINSSASQQFGNKSAPFKSIQQAIEEAKILGLKDVFVAAGTYTEEITLKAGISVRGGYSQTAWTRDILANISKIKAPGDTAVRANADITTALTSTTVLDGFTIEVTGTKSLYAVRLASSSPTISNCTLNVTNTDTTDNHYTLAIFANGAATAKIFNNQFTVTSTSSPSFPSQAGVWTVGSTPNIQNNIFNITGQNYFVCAIVATNQSSLTAINNVALTTSASQAHGVITVSDGGTPVIKNNTLATTSITNANCVRLLTNALTTSAYIENNICFSTNAGHIGIFEQNAGATNPTSFTNNLIFDFTAGMYRDENANNRTLQGNLTTALTTTPVGTSSGNLAPWDNAVGPHTTNVFAAGFSLSNLKTWAIRGYVNATNGMADIDASGGWSAGDIGADVSIVGPK